MGGYYVLALHVLGMPELATSEFARLRAEGLYIPAHRDGWYQTAYDFFLARITAEELLAKAAGPPTSHMSLSEGHFYVGVQLLSRGRKKEATLHFEKSVAAGVWYFIEHQLSRAFLARRAKDPTWPPWIESTE